MIKREELANPTSCLNRARPYEMVFTLLARDPVAPFLIRLWCFLRLVLRKNHWNDPQINDALAAARRMSLQRRMRKSFLRLRGHDQEWLV